MRSLLFLTHIVKDENNGVWKKVLSQVKALAQNSFNIDLVYRLDDNSYILKSNGIEKKIKLQQKNIIFYNVSKIIKKKYDVVYIRKPHGGFYALFLFFALKKIKKINPNALIYMEIPTYPYANEVRTFKGYISHYIYELSFCVFKKYLTKILCIGDAPEYIKNVPTVKFRNGVDTDLIQMIDNRPPHDSFIFVGIANLVYWHGYDRLLMSIKKYNGTKNVKFYIIGDTEPELSRLKSIVHQYNLDDRVIFLGRKSQIQIINILKTVHVCVDSLGRHRSGNKKNDSIKSKEYAAMGLPFIKSHDDDSFNNEPFIYQVSANEKEFSIDNIICWYEDLPSNFRLQERNYAINNLAWEKIYQDFFLKEDCC
ncbi:glycosyltransferase [Escherichia coli]|nr:glycosyltransferase [Escherichia coli]EMD0813182.1 glycosyltransferase [Escherichia coli]